MLANQNKNVNGEEEKKQTFSSYIKSLKTSPTTSSRKEKKSQSKKEQEIESAEYLYVNSFIMSEDSLKMRIQKTDSKPLVFKWSTNHWKMYSNFEMGQEAQDWLKVNMPHKYNIKNANSCSEMLKFNLAEMNKDKKETIIPFLDKWLLVDEATGTLNMMAPDYNFPIKYVINSEIKTKGDTYTPKDLPADSLFKNFLDMSMPDREKQELIQEYCGYTLLNNTKFQKAQVWEGMGQNGKSVLLSVMSALHVNARSISLDKLNGFGLAPLCDASLIISAETPKKGINENVLKKAIAGDLMDVEKKFSDVFSIKPTAKWIISCNTFPTIDDKTDGVWRRLQIITWDVQISSDKVIRDLDSQIIDKELHLVVDWCLQGLQRLLARGDFNEPECVLAVKEQKRVESNTVESFIRESEYGLSTECNSEKAKIYAEYRDYCEEFGYGTCSLSEFWKRVQMVFKGRIIESKKRVGNSRARYVNLTIDPSFFNRPTTEQSKVDSPTLPLHTSSKTTQEPIKTVASTQTPTEPRKEPIQAHSKEILDDKPNWSKTVQGKKYLFAPALLKAHPDFKEEPQNTVETECSYQVEETSPPLMPMATESYQVQQPKSISKGMYDLDDELDPFSDNYNT